MSIFSLVDKLEHVNDVDSLAVAIAQNATLGDEDVDRVHAAMRGLRDEGRLFWAVVRLVKIPAMEHSLLAEAVTYYLYSAPTEVTSSLLALLVSQPLDLLPQPPRLDDGFDNVNVLLRYSRLLADLPRLVGRDAASMIIESIGHLDLTTCESEVRGFAWTCLRLLVPLMDDPASAITRLGSADLRVRLAASMNLSDCVDKVSCFAVAASPSKASRKAARHVMERLYSADAEAWELFWAIQDSMDEYASHLFKELLPKLSLIAACPRWGCLAIESILTRCFDHGNDLLLKNAYSALFAAADVAAVISDEYMIKSVLPSLWSCTVFFEQTVFANAAESFLSCWIGRQADSSAALLFLLRNPHAHFGPCIALARALHAMKGSVDFTVYDSLLDFIQRTSKGYPLVLRRNVIQTLIPIFDKMTCDTIGMARLTAFIPDKLNLVLSDALVESLESLNTSIELDVAVGASRLVPRDTVDMMNELEALDSRLYAPVSERYACLHALAVAILRGYRCSNAGHVCAPAAAAALNKRDEESLVMFTPVWSVILQSDKGEYSSLASAAVDAILDDSSSTIVKATACVLLRCCSSKSVTDIWHVQLSMHGVSLPRSSSISWGEACLRPLRGYRTTDDLLDAFFTAKLAMVAESNIAFPGGVDGWLAALSEAGPAQLTVLHACYERLDQSTIDEDHVAQMAISVKRFIERRTHAPLSTGQVVALMKMMFNQQTLSVAPIVSVEVMRKLLYIGTFTPAVSRPACASFLDALHGIKERRVFSELLAEMCSYREATYSSEVEGVEAFTRTTCLIYLEQCPELSRLVIPFILQRLDDELDSTVKRNAPKCPLPLSDSYRMQLRSWQALVVLCKHLQSDDDFTSVAKSIFRHLNSPNQVEVKEYQDLVCCYLCKKFAHAAVTQYLVPALRQINQPSQCVASFIITGGYLLQHLSSDNSVFKELFEILVPYLTSNAAFLRAQCQYWFYNCRDKIKGMSGIADRIVEFVEKQKECVSMRKRHAPIYARWNPDGLEGTGIAILALQAVYKDQELVPSMPMMLALKDAVHLEMSSVWHGQPGLEEARVLNGEESAGDNQLVGRGFQRKYDPNVNALFPAVDVGDGKKSRKSTELIVIASFVDKTTNLAGLCRTAEVFGASKLVIDNKGIVKETEFKSMAVTADHWLDIEEVSTEHMQTYLARLRGSGFRIVGLEQTSTSTLLSNYQWPRQTALVLGSEREGLPVWMMSELDSCVEIPQVGMVRSLNVHVSGALAIWEYNKQHIVS